MKGLILLFLVVCFGAISWGYMDKQSKRNVKEVVRGNLGAFIFAARAGSRSLTDGGNTVISCGRHLFTGRNDERLSR